MDFFKELIVSKRKDKFDYAKIAGVYLLSFILIFIALIFMRYLSSFGLLIVAGIAYGAYLLVTQTNVEFEYIVTNGDIDIDKIINRRRRKRVYSGHCRDFSVLAPVNDERHRHEFNSVSKTLNCAGSLKSENAYFAITDIKGERTRLIFEPTPDMLGRFKFFIAGKIFIK